MALRSYFWLSLIFCLPLLKPARAADVRVSEGTIILPTYLLGPQDPDPPFSLVYAENIYPYPMLDDLTNQKEIKTYPAVYLENEYLKATILPSIGGRLYSLFDKVSRREVFYCNHVIKYGLVGSRGAWISGGIEFNFPYGHTTDTVSPVDHRIRRNPDGSATVIVGDMDQVSNMHWEVALTLRPGVARLEQRVTLFNATPLNQLYWWWANAAVPATADMQFIYPMRKANPDRPGEVQSYPTWEGVNYSWYREMRHHAALFGLDVHRSFFGAYYHAADDGVIHVADYHWVYGKKMWTWGVADDGLIWTHLLTDDDGAYNEIQSGHFETQLGQEFMSPHKVEEWTEYWYPVQGLGGGFVEGTPHFAINVLYRPASGAAAPAALLAVSPTEAMQGARIVVKLGSELAKEFPSVSFEPLKTKTFSIPVRDLDVARRELEVTIENAKGESFLHWFAGAPIDGNPNFVSPAGAPPVIPKPDSELSTEQLFCRGVAQEKMGEHLEAERIYQEVARREPGYVPVLLKEAQRAYMAADFPSAEGLIVRALDSDLENPQTQFLAGVIYRGDGKLTLAKDAFWEAIRFGSYEPQAFAQLGEIAIRQRDYPRAEKLLRQALTYNPDDGVALSDLAAALRSGGNTQESAKVAGEAEERMLLLPEALAERWRSEDALSPNSSAAQQAAMAWRQAVGFRPQAYLEAGAWYREIGDLASSDFVLQAALRDLKSNEVSPLVYYDLAANAWDEGKTGRGCDYASKAAQASPEAVFPNRLLEAAVLREVLTHNASDSHAQYFLGTFLFAHGRFEDAARLWRQAASEGYQYSVLYLDLGVFAWKVENDLEAAARYYQRAVGLAPHDYRLYVALDEVYTQAGETASREKLLAAAPADVRDKDTVRTREAMLKIQIRQYGKALAVLLGHAFKPWEGGLLIRQLFVQANLEKGREAVASQQYALAERAFREALQYPENFGVGKPDKPQDEASLYWLGKTLAAEGKADGARDVWQEAVGEGRAGTDYPERSVNEAPFYFALALKQLGRSDDGERILDELLHRVASGGGSAFDYYLAGLVEDYREHRGQATEDFRRAMQLDPSLWQARIGMDREDRGRSISARTR